MILNKYEIVEEDSYIKFKFYYNEDDLTFNIISYLVELCNKNDYYYSKYDGVFNIKVYGRYDKHYNRINPKIDYDLIEELYKNPTKCFMYHEDENPVLDLFSKVMVKCFESS